MEPVLDLDFEGEDLAESTAEEGEALGVGLAGRTVGMSSRELSGDLHTLAEGMAGVK